MFTVVMPQRDASTQISEIGIVGNENSLDSKSIELRLSKLETEIANLKEYKIKEVAVLSIITYGVCSSIFLAIGSEEPLFNAFVPTTGFVISTLVKDRVLNLFQRAKNGCLSCFRSSNNVESNIVQIV